MTARAPSRASRGLACVLLALFCLQLAAFEPPQRHPQSRYEQDWARNPFTLKTAPVALEKQNFARDLALGGIDNLGDGHRVVLVNVKTQQRFPIKEGTPGPDGLVVKKVHRATTLKDSYVEVARGAELARLEYNETYLKSVAASISPGTKDRKTAATAPSPPQAGSPGSTVASSIPSGAADAPPRPAGSPPPQPLTASPNVASVSPAPPASPGSRSETPTTRQRRRVQTVPNTP